MKVSGIEGSLARSRILNAVPLQNAVLCAECDVVSDSPHDVCMVCGSHSLFNIARVFGSKLREVRASIAAVNNRDILMRPCVAFPEASSRPRKGNGGIAAICSCLLWRQ